MEIAFLLLTILLSAACAGLVTHRLNICKERLTFRAAKAEELYCVADRLENGLTSFFASSYSLISGYADSDLESAQATEIGQHLSRLRMLVGFYFPALRTSLARVIAAASTSYATLENYRAAEKQEKEQAGQTLDTSVAELRDALDAMKSNILTAGEREITPARRKLFKQHRVQGSASRVMSIAA
jgi:hypothetical protein